MASLPDSRQTLAVVTPGGACSHSGLSPRVAAFMNAAQTGTAIVAGEPVRQNRARLIEPDPDAGGELRREPDEPGVVEIVGRAGLARGGQREAQAPGVRAGARVDDVGHHGRHQNAVMSLMA